MLKYLKNFQVRQTYQMTGTIIDFLPFLQRSLTVHIAEHTTHSHSSSLLVLVYVVLVCRL